MQSEISQTQKDDHCMTSLTSRMTETEQNRVCRSQGRGRWGDAGQGAQSLSYVG